MGVVVIGPPLTGKTTIIQLLSRVKKLKSLMYLINNFFIFILFFHRHYLQTVI